MPVRSLPLAFIEVRAISHATENLEKVMTALQNVISSEILDEVQISREQLEGHFGNPIVLMKARVNRKSGIRKMTEELFNRLPRQELEKLSSDLERRIDEDGNFYIRLDKQAAYRGEIRLGEFDVIRLQFKFSLPKRQRQQVIEASRQLILQTT
ncbi:MAG: RNA-binding domain-containing protein [Candidatus Bathyarchaeia archaeon]